MAIDPMAVAVIQPACAVQPDQHRLASQSFFSQCCVVAVAFEDERGSTIDEAAVETVASLY
jgi:hypothetical protein